MRIIKCDRCECDMSKSSNYGYIAINHRKALTGDLTNDNPYENMDFCDSCLHEIEQAILGPNQIIVDQEVESEVGKVAAVLGNTKEAISQKRPLDIGKIIALKNAGWKVKDIADEMGVESHTISQAIWKYKKNNEFSKKSEVDK